MEVWHMRSPSRNAHNSAKKLVVVPIFLENPPIQKSESSWIMLPPLTNLEVLN